MKLNKKLAVVMMASLAAMTFVGCSSSEETVAPETEVETPVAEGSEEATEGEIAATPSSDLYNKIIEGVELPMLAAKDETMVADTYGIDMSMLADFTVMGPVMSAHITEIGVFHVADEANVEAVKTAVEGRLDALKNGGAFYPEHVEIVNKGQVVVNGNFVLLVADSAVEDIVANFNANFVEAE